MKSIIFLVPLLALAACEGSIADAVGEAATGTTSSFSDGSPIGSSASNPGTFAGVTLAGPDNIIFTTGEEFSIRAEGDSEAIEQLRYKISGDEIKIGRDSDGKSWGDSGEATIYISAPSLKSAKLAGSGNIRVANIETPSLSSKIAGSGNLTLAGTTESVDISIAGSGDISGKDLKAASASISVAGSGDVELSSDGSVDAKVMGSGDVRIHGKAKCKSRAMGSGDITCG